MKKAAVFIATVILSALCAVSALADEGALPEDQTIDVYAKAVYTLPDGCYDAEETPDGEHTVEMPDGVKITLTPKTAVSRLRLVVAPITAQDAQAYQWITSCTAGLGSNLLFYDIYFVDEYGNRVDVDTTLDVSIALTEDYGIPTAAAVNADGSVSPLASTSGSDKISFSIEKGGFYAIAAARSDSDTDSDADSDTGSTGSSKSGKGGSTAPTSAKTGDSSTPALWLVLLLASAAAGAALYAGRKKHSDQTK